MLTPIPPTECSRARESMSAQLDGELSELGSARLSAHLRECPECTAYALEMGAIAARLRAGGWSSRAGRSSCHSGFGASR